MPLAIQNKIWMLVNDLPVMSETEEVSKKVAEQGWEGDLIWLLYELPMYLQEILKSEIWVETPNTISSLV
jgi:hypothetical protein